MKRLVLVAAILSLLPIGFGANLNIDASKKKKTPIIKPGKFSTKQKSSFQNKRFSAKKLKSGVVLHRDSNLEFSPENPRDSMNRSNGMRSGIDGEKQEKASRILDQVVTSSEEFEKAFRNALTVELSKRAANQVEVKKTKADLSQGEINKDSKVRKGNQDGFNVQQAGGNPD